MSSDSNATLVRSAVDAAFDEALKYYTESPGNPKQITVHQEVDKIKEKLVQALQDDDLIAVDHPFEDTYNYLQGFEKITSGDAREKIIAAAEVIKKMLPSPYKVGKTYDIREALAVAGGTEPAFVVVTDVDGDYAMVGANQWEGDATYDGHLDWEYAPWTIQFLPGGN